MQKRVTFFGLATKSYKMLWLHYALSQSIESLIALTSECYGHNYVVHKRYRRGAEKRVQVDSD